MKRKASSKKKYIVTTIAVLAALVGAAVAVYTYLQKKAKKLGEQLDYDGSLYYEDEDPFADLEEPDGAFEAGEGCNACSSCAEKEPIPEGDIDLDEEDVEKE